jgi:Na+/proline symporter
VLASRSEKVAQRSTVIAAFSYLLIGLMPVFLGLIAGSANLSLEKVPSDQVLPMMAQSFLPTFLFILFSGALVSAILSTVDTALLVGSSLVCHNVLIPVLGIVNERRKVLITRMGVVVCGLIAYRMALGSESVYDLVVEASALGTSGIFILVTFGLFTNFGGTFTAYMTLITATTIYAFGRIVALANGTDEEGRLQVVSAVANIASEDTMYIFDSIYTISLVAGLGVYLLTGFLEKMRDSQSALAPVE